MTHSVFVNFFLSLSTQVASGFKVELRLRAALVSDYGDVLLPILWLLLPYPWFNGPVVCEL